MGLYENENIKMWDPETGENPGAIWREAEEENLSKQMEESDLIRSMAVTEGWKIVNTWVDACIERYKLLLTMEEDFDKIKRMQEAIKAYMNVTTYVLNRAQEAEDFKQQRTPETQG